MRAAQYVRMSTEHQQYSIENQQAAIAEYAVQHGFEIVQTYADPARSGLDLAHRPGLRKLLEDVLSTHAGYQAILVYDVSRWGRFQDTDESAYYEFLCKKAGVRVHYCAEPFDSEDQGMTVALIKSLKRAMAGEYLRELSHKVFVGQCRIAMYGYKLGGAPGYGLRRLLISREGTEKGILAPGERKSIDSDRVLYVLGPSAEVQVIREIYDWFVNERLSAPKISDRLNERDVKREPNGKWNHWAILDILTNPKYTGSMVYNRTSKKLGSRQVRNPREQWIVKPASFEAIVSRSLFEAVQRRLTQPRCLSEQQLLDGLRLVLERHGRLNVNVIDAAPEIPSYQYYAKRFGSLSNAYAAIGYPGNVGYMRCGGCKSRLDKMRDQIRRELTEIVKVAGRRVVRTKRGVRIEGFGRLRIGVATVKRINRRTTRWAVRVCNQPRDPVFVVRIGEDYETVLDFLLLFCPPHQGSFSFTEEGAHQAFLGHTVAEAVRALLAKAES